MKTLRWQGRVAWALGSAALVLAAGAAVTSGAASAAVTAPARSCCRILTQSAAAAWGNNLDGQLGNGTQDDGVNPNWAAVSGLSGGVVAVSAGDAHALALTSDGSVWAWGGNSSGQLGNGTTTASAVPVQVPGLTGIVAVSAGSDVSVALRSDGTVWTWGGNSGQLLGGRVLQAQRGLAQ